MAYRSWELKRGQGRSVLIGLSVGLAVASQSSAFISVTETFTDLGAGVNDTRFDTYIGNDIQRPITTLTNPVDQQLIEMGFGPEVLDYNNVKTNQFGLTTTGFVGGSAGGEFGGQFNWLDYGYAADTNIGALTMGEHFGGNGGTQANPLKIQASMILRNFSPQNDENVTIGYFNDPSGMGQADDMRNRDGFARIPSTTMMAGIGFIGDGRFFLFVNGAESGVFPSVGVGSPFTIDLNVYVDEAFPGEVQPQGVIAGTVGGQTVSFNRATNGNQSVGVFGIGQSFLDREFVQNTWRRSIAFIDDVTYSVLTDGGFDADPVRFSTAVVQPPLDGDLDGDGFVGIADLNIVLGNWNQTVPPGDPLADVAGGGVGGNDPDGFVGIADLNVVLGNWNAGTPPAAGAVPEPTTLGLLGFGGLAMLIRRRR